METPDNTGTPNNGNIWIAIRLEDGNSVLPVTCHLFDTLGKEPKAYLPPKLRYHYVDGKSQDIRCVWEYTTEPDGPFDFFITNSSPEVLKHIPRIPYTRDGLAAVPLQCVKRGVPILTLRTGQPNGQEWDKLLVIANPLTLYLTFHIWNSKIDKTMIPLIVSKAEAILAPIGIRLILEEECIKPHEGPVDLLLEKERIKLHEGPVDLLLEKDGIKLHEGQIDVLNVKDPYMALARAFNNNKPNTYEYKNGSFKFSSGVLHIHFVGFITDSKFRSIDGFCYHGEFLAPEGPRDIGILLSLHNTDINFLGITLAHEIGHIINIKRNDNGYHIMCDKSDERDGEHPLLDASDWSEISNVSDISELFPDF